MYSINTIFNSEKHTSLLILVILFFLFPFGSQSQNWGRNTESEFTNEALDIETDASGNVYVAGYITGETAFAANVVQLSAAGNGDIYIAKYNSSGTLIWVKQFGGNFSDRAYDLAIDQNNDVYVTGQFYGQVNFGSFSLSSNANSKDIFLLKLDPSGNVIWAKGEGGAQEENAYGLACDNSNNVILTGQFTGVSNIGGQTFTSATDPLINQASSDFFIAKYSSAGVPLWAHNGFAKYEDRGLAVSTDSQNNIYFTGQFSDTLVFNGQTINNNAYNLGFLAKLSPSGNLNWINLLKAGMVMAYDLEVNTGDEVIVVGDFRGSMYYQTANASTSITNSFGKKIFALKTNNNGDYIWHTTLGSVSDVSARSVSVNTSKEIFVTGYFKCGFTELQTESAIFNSVGFKDAYLWKISDLGQSAYVKQFGSKKDDEGHGVAILNSDAIICGSYTQDLNIPTFPSGSYSTSINHFDLTAYYSSEPGHVYLHGDQSRNSFLTNAVKANTPLYNFFYSQPTDSLLGFIPATNDTIHLCGPEHINYSPQTYSHFGPDYFYLWENGDTTQAHLTSATELHHVTVSRQDQCVSGVDSVVTIMHSLPNLPLMSDNLGLAVNKPGSNYFDYNFCAPDSVEIWFTNLNTGNSIEISFMNGPMLQNDTLAHFYAADGQYQITIQDSFCTNTGNFSINLDYTTIYDIEPYIVLIDTMDYDDSIAICQNLAVQFELLDSTNNPSSIFYLEPDDSIISHEWFVNGTSYGNGQDTTYLEFIPQYSGWHTIAYAGIVGYMNACGVDTLHFYTVDSFYIELLDLPSFSTTISGDNLLCPNGSVYLTTSNTSTTFNWWGPPGSVQWTSANNDSAQVSAEGYYHYGGLLTDSISGCSVNYDFVYYLDEKSPPTITITPEDGIICPNDTVHMTIPNLYQSYDWTGPSGSSLSLSHQHSDIDQGFYYCTVLDNEGCYLTSPPVELREYTSPYLDVEPSNIICGGESSVITAVFIGEGTANWISPFVSVSPSITVNQAGWYVCELSQCGITVLDSIQIIDGSFSVNITAADTILCFGDEISISATPGFSSYDWNNGYSGSTILVDQEGYYSTTVINNYGCESQSDIIHIGLANGSFPPAIADTFICIGGDIVLGNNLDTLLWFSGDTTLIASATSINVSQVYSDTSIFASFDVPQCENVYTEIKIIVIDSLELFGFVGDTISCTQNQIVLSPDPYQENVNWYVNGNFHSSLPNLSLNYTGNSEDTVMAIFSNACFADTLIQIVSWVPPVSIDFSPDSIFACSSEMINLTYSDSTIETFWTWGNEFVYSDSLNETAANLSGYVYIKGTDQYGCEALSDSILIEVPDFNYTVINNTEYACEGDSVQLGLIATVDSFFWSTPWGIMTDSVFNFTLSIQNNGVYILHLTDSLACNYSDTFHINVNELSTELFPDDTMFCANSIPDLEFGIPNNLSFEWQLGSTYNTSVPTNGEMWHFTLSDSGACFVEDSIHVTIIDCENEMPNVITPNNDGINDFLVIDEAVLFPDNYLVITNRWGNIIYQQHNYQNTFNGEGLADGTYFYVFYKVAENPETKSEQHLTIRR